MLINIDYNMVKVVQGEVSKRPGNVFYTYTRTPHRFLVNGNQILYSVNLLGH